MREDFETWVYDLLDEGYDLSDYSWDEMYDIFEETLQAKKEREERIAARRARVKEMEREGAVMTSERRTREAAKQRRQEKAREAHEKKVAAAASKVLASLGHSGRVSEKPMGSEAPEPREAAPAATRRLKTGLRRDTLGKAADDILRSIRNEDYEMILDYLLYEGYATDYDSAETMVEHMSEAWLSDIFESEMWIQKAIKKPGALRKSLKAKAGKNISAKSLSSAAKKGGKFGKRARLAQTLRKFH